MTQINGTNGASHPRKTVAYNGTVGSFSYQVASVIFKDHNLIPVPDSGQLEEGLISGIYDVGIMPLVNSMAGGIDHTIDVINRHTLKLMIERSWPLNVIQEVGGLGNPGEVKYVASQGPAIKQCEGKLRAHFPNYSPILTEDTALSVKYLAEDRDRMTRGEGPIHYKDPLNTAVVASRAAFELYGIQTYGLGNMADRGDENYTTFIQIRKRGGEDNGLELLVTGKPASNGTSHRSRWGVEYPAPLGGKGVADGRLKISLGASWIPAPEKK